MSNELRRIVVGTSLDEASDPVVATALRIGQRTGADLYLAHGFPMPAIYGGGVYGTGAIQQQLQHDQARHRQRLERQLARCAASEDDFAEIVIELDSGHRLLDMVAEQKDADLLVVGAHEGQGPLDGFLGSTADRLLRRTCRPVLVVRGQLEEIERVLAPVDLSELSARCAARGLALVDQMGLGGPADVQALFVLSRIDREGSAHFEPAEIDRFALEKLRGFLADLPPRQGGQIEPVLRTGRPRHEILDYLAFDDADLVLMGTHGRTGFERFLMGSIASEVLRHLDRSALVIPPDGQETADTLDPSCFGEAEPAETVDTA